MEFKPSLTVEMEPTSKVWWHSRFTFCYRNFFQPFFQNNGGNFLEVKDLKNFHPNVVFHPNSIVKISLFSSNISHRRYVLWSVCLPQIPTMKNIIENNEIFKIELG